MYTYYNDIFVGALHKNTVCALCSGTKQVRNYTHTAYILVFEGFHWINRDVLNKFLGHERIPVKRKTMRKLSFAEATNGKKK
jgi:hypothetical protein